MSFQNVFLAAFLLVCFVACTDEGNLDTVTFVPVSQICADRTIDSLNPPSEVAVLGNSLLMGNGTFGLSASDSTKDYFFRLDSAFRVYNPDCVSRRIMAKTVERTKTDSALKASIAENIVPNISAMTDMVIIQLGDNIESAEDFARMPTTVSSIYNAICTVAARAKIVWVGEWYSTSDKQKLLRKMAASYGAQFVDISDLYTKENQGRVGDVVTYPEERTQCVKYKSYSISGDTVTITFSVNGSQYTSSVVVSEYHDYAGESRIDIVGHQGIVVDAKAASHPNDRGFERIAERILGEIGF